MRIPEFSVPVTIYVKDEEFVRKNLEWFFSKSIIVKPMSELKEEMGE